MCLERSTRLVKSQQGAGKEYVCIFRLHESVDNLARIKQVGNNLDRGNSHGLKIPVKGVLCLSLFFPIAFFFIVFCITC